MPLVTLHPGDRVGPYEVVGPLGAGGMGEVYRALDQRLGREVALKVLPELFTSDSERLARFEREARALAALNHPNVAQIYGVEEAGGARALVLELVEGPTLADRIERGPVPLEEALGHARQIARALEAAHSRGIIHRDLKPANVKLGSDGTVKVLDFGLAKALDLRSPSVTAPVLANSPTLTYQATMAGQLLGTASYMSPEQARGEEVDRRSDVWAFGVVLWEMLTGRRLFGGGTISDTLAGILRDPLDLAALPSGCPPALGTLLRRCLERDPDRRLHDVADARIVIEDLLDGTEPQGDVTSAPAPAGPGRRARLGLVWAASLAAVALAAGALGYRARSPAAAGREPLRLSIQLAPDQELGDDNALFTFAPDGESLVMVGKHGGQGMILRRVLGESEPRPIEGTEDGRAPFFSPDGQWMGFVAGGRLRKVRSEGGRPFDLAESRGAGGATWLPDDTLVFAPIYSDGLFRIPAAGGTAARLTTPNRADGVLGHWWPDRVPGTDLVVFTAFRTPIDESRIGVLDLGSGEIDWVVEGGFFGRYVSTGHLLYARSYRLFAIPFDPSSATVSGSAVPLLDDLRANQAGGWAMFAVSSTGTLAYATESLGNPPSELVWFDREGAARLVSGERQRYLSVALSPDERHAAVTIQQESQDLWIQSLERGTLSRLTSGSLTEFDPVWSHQGQELFYVVDQPPFVLHRIPVGAAQSGAPIWSEAPQHDSTSPDVSPDGRTLVFVHTEPQTGDNLYTRPVDGSAPAQPFRVTRFEEQGPTFSPDGRWIAYQSDETGRFEVYVAPFPGPGEGVQISSDGGTEPTWARSTGELLFRRRDELRAVTTRLSEGFDFDPPRTLFPLAIADSAGVARRNYAVTADGQRILAIRVPEASVPRRVEIVTDWTKELAQRLASSR